MRYITLLITLLALCSVSCARDYCPRVPRPVYPVMKKVDIKGGVIQGEDVQNVLDNMLGMSKYIDSLYICPAWEEQKE